MSDDFFDLGTIAIPASPCLVCGVTETRTGDNCPRCGATVADIRTLLRAGATAYAAARSAALDARFAEARGQLRVAASLGLESSPVWQRLRDAVETADPPVCAKDSHDYAIAYHAATRGRFVPVALSNTPVTQELDRLSRAAVIRSRQENVANGMRYVLFGIACVLLAHLCGC